MENGSVVVTRTPELMECKRRILQPARCIPIDTKYSIDIDTEQDFNMAQALMEGSGNV
jgi:CMP-N-acetylneuraminic acid synthetase